MHKGLLVERSTPFSEADRAEHASQIAETSLCLPIDKATRLVMMKS